MKTLNKLMSEALDERQKRVVDTWEKGNHSFSDHVFGKDGHTVYEPFSENKAATPHPKVAEHLEKHGYKMHDYVKGYAIDKHGRQMSIGKILNKTKADPETKKAFETDPARQSSQKSNLMIAYTRHPHHVAAMSTGTGWESCMQFDRGMYRRHLQDDVHEGTHVAYLIHGNDKEIKNPIARIAMKPFHSEDGEKHTVVRPEPRTYGHGGDAFTSSVRSWSEKNFPMKPKRMYHVNEHVYNDGIGETAFSHDKETFDYILQHGDRYHKKTVYRLSLPHAEARLKEITNRPEKSMSYSHYQDFKEILGYHPSLAKDHVNHPDDSIREDIAHAHPELAHHFVNDPSSDVRAYAASHKPELFMNDKATDVRRNIAAKPAYAHHFLNDHSKEVRGLAWNTASEKHITNHLETNANIDSNNLVTAAYRFKNIAKKLTNHSSSAVRLAASEHLEAASKMINDPDHVVREYIASLHPELGHHFVNDPSDTIRAAAARSTEHPEKFLNDKSHHVRLALAYRPATAEKLINDPHPLVRKAIAGNDSKFAHHFVNDPDETVRSSAASFRPDLFVNDKSPEVRKHVVATTGAKFVKQHMMGETDPGVKHMILFHHPGLAHLYLSDTNQSVREMAEKKHKDNLRYFGKDYHKRKWS